MCVRLGPASGNAKSEGCMRVSSVVAIGGRSGVGKTSVAAEMHALLAQRDVRHCWIEGDYLDMAHPTPWKNGHDLAERNLSAMWRNYRELSYFRLIYTNTAAVTFTEPIVEAMGDAPTVLAVLLTATDTTTKARLVSREIGRELDLHVRRSAQAAEWLESVAPEWVHRVPTDSRTVGEIAEEIIGLAGW